MKFSLRHTKIIATIGPSSYNESTITKLIKEGVNLFRLNFSHGNHKTHEHSVKLIRQSSQLLGIEVAIIADLQGPKIRLADFGGEITVYKDDLITLTNDINKLDRKIFPTSYLSLAKDVKKGERILIDDGLIELIVQDVSNETDVTCLVKYGGIMKSRKGINLPDSKLSVSSFTKKDLVDLKFISSIEVDFIALSFVRSADDIKNFKISLEKFNCDLPIIAKIEKPSAIKHINEIIDCSYAIMIARGDLGVEIPADQVPFEQKRIVKLCSKKGCPVIIATQMLESMITKAVPTRAEANDIANAVIDGADCLMLSAETAAGLNPIRSVSTMSKIIQTAEKKFLNEDWQDYEYPSLHLFKSADAVSFSAVHMAVDLNAKLLSCVTLQGNTALKIARFRPPIPILAVTDNIKTLRRLMIGWGISAILVKQIFNTRKSLDRIVQAIDDFEFLKKGDLVIFTAGLPNFSSESTNTIKLVNIKKDASASFM